MLYLGTSLIEAEKAVHETFLKYQQPFGILPVSYLDSYSAVPISLNWEIIQYYCFGGSFYSIVMFDLFESETENKSIVGQGELFNG